MAVELVLGGQLTWYAETDRHARTACAHHWPGVPNLGDIRTVDWIRVEPVDVLTAGFACQDISNAGKRAGITGEHSSLWSAVADAVRVLRPPLVFVENVAALLRRGFDVVEAGTRLLDRPKQGPPEIERWVDRRKALVPLPSEQNAAELTKRLPGQTRWRWWVAIVATLLITNVMTGFVVHRTSTPEPTSAPATTGDNPLGWATTSRSPSTAGPTLTEYPSGSRRARCEVGLHHLDRPRRPHRPALRDRSRCH